MSYNIFKNLNLSGSAIDNAPIGQTTPAAINGNGTTGLSVVIKDGKGDAATNPITITPASGTIDGASSVILNQNYASTNLLYNGSSWNVL